MFRFIFCLKNPRSQKIFSKRIFKGNHHIAKQSDNFSQEADSVYVLTPDQTRPNSNADRETPEPSLATNPVTPVSSSKKTLDLQLLMRI